MCFVNHAHANEGCLFVAVVNHGVAAQITAVFTNSFFIAIVATVLLNVVAVLTAIS